MKQFRVSETRGFADSVIDAPPESSFRDPEGYLSIVDGRVLRFISDSAAGDFAEFTNSPIAKRFVEQGRLVSTRILAADDLAELTRFAANQVRKAVHSHATIAEHERIPFQSFPYEWPSEMLFAAAELTLDLADAVLESGFGLKDASPYNVLFRGPEPVFVDLLSFERREPKDPTWLPSGQFARTFLRPLLLSQKLGVPTDQMLFAYRDGPDAEDISPMLSFFRRFSPQVMNLVSIPAFLSRRRWSQSPTLYKKRTVSSTEQAQFVLGRLYKSLRRKLYSLRPESDQTSSWTPYVDSVDHPEGYFSTKTDLMTRIIGEIKPRRVLDVGCNTGTYSMAAARHGARVVSIDTDRAVVGRLWKKATQEKLDILPLVIDLTRPTPGMGWLNSECASFLSRAEGYFDCIFMLAVIHHMLVRERVPLQQILSLAARITTRYLVIEFVGVEDPLFKRIVRGNDHLYTHLTPEYFESVAAEHFDIRESIQVGNSSRRMYVLRKKLVAA